MDKRKAIQILDSSDYFWCRPTDGEMIALSMAIDALSKQDRPKGHWILQKGHGWYGGGRTMCSECGYGYSWGAYHEPEEFDFCPHCGAPMETKWNKGR